MSLCKSCDAEIIWAVSAATGRPAPIDAAPSDGGNIHLREAPRTSVTGTETGDKVIVYTLMTKLAASQYQGADAHRSHFATCPFAGSHR